LRKKHFGVLLTILTMWFEFFNHSDAYHMVRDKQKRRKYLVCLTWG
jgi:hypothetical protein